jgi:diketogulonate reductase-like aldo/keto reductase
MTVNVTLNNGTQMPALGFGVFQGVDHVLHGLARHIGIS